MAGGKSPTRLMFGPAYVGLRFNIISLRHSQPRRGIWREPLRSVPAILHTVHLLRRESLFWVGSGTGNPQAAKLAALKRVGTDRCVPSARDPLDQRG
jgi:hypothetical protein